MQRYSTVFQNNCGKIVDSGVFFAGLSSLLFLPLFLPHFSLSIIQKRHFIWCCIPPTSLKKNNEDLQNAKRHVGVSLIAAESYQSLKQMAYQLRGFVLDMPTTPQR